MQYLIKEGSEVPVWKVEHLVHGRHFARGHSRHHW